MCTLRKSNISGFWEGHKYWYLGTHLIPFWSLSGFWNHSSSIIPYEVYFSAYFRLCFFQPLFSYADQRLLSSNSFFLSCLFVAHYGVGPITKFLLALRALAQVEIQDGLQYLLVLSQLTVSTFVFLVLHKQNCAMSIYASALLDPG